MSFFKVLVIGDVATGKTSLVNRLVNNNYSETYKATIGCEFGFKVIEVDGESIRVQLWDLAGQDRLGGISRLYCRDAHGALVVSDVTKPETIAKTAKWKSQVDEYVRAPDGTSIPMVLCLNKYDLVSEDSVPADRLEQCKNEHGFIQGFFTSAKSGLNADDAFQYLVRAILKRNADRPPSAVEGKSQTPGGGLKLARQGVDTKAKKGKCC